MKQTEPFSHAERPGRLRSALFGAAALLAAVAAALWLPEAVDPLNAPRPVAQYAQNTLFSSFGGRSPKTLDPQVSYSSDETLYTYNVYEPLYGYHYLKRPYTIVPRTAERVVEPTYWDKDGHRLTSDAPGKDVAVSVYRIPLKRGIRFAPHPAFARDADGNYLYHALTDEVARTITNPLALPERGTRELTAHDYVYGIKRLADPANVSPILGMMREHLPGLGDLAERVAVARAQGKGKNAWLDLRGFSLDGVEAPDDYTLEIRLRGKYPQFDNWLSMAFFAPMAWEAEKFYANARLRENNVTLATWPVGTGPYMLVESRQNREHVLKRNPNYRFDPYPCEGEAGDAAKGLLADCGKPMPFIDTIVMQLEKEAVPTTSKFLQGYYDSPQITRLDVGQSYLVAAGDDPRKAQLYRDKKLQFPTAVEANIWYLGFNWLDPVLGGGKTPEEAERNRKLRQAISIAVDWEEQIAIFEKGQGQSAHGPLAPGLFGWRDDGPSAMNPVVYRRDEKGRAMRRSIDEARELMREAGYPDGRDARTGKPLVLNFDWQSAGPGSKAFLEWFAKQFAKLGIELEIRATDYNRFQEKMMKGSAQIFYWGWLADYPDAENFLFLLYGPNGKVVSGGGGENAANYANPEFDRLFEEMRDLPDGPRKAELIDRMIRIVQTDAPWSFGYFPSSAAALHQWVGNAKPTQMVRNNVQYMRVDPKLRVEMIRAWNAPVLWPAALLVLALVGLFVFIRRHLAGRAARNALGRDHRE